MEQSKRENWLAKLHYKQGLNWLYLAIIISLAFILRVNELDKIPLGIYVDEAMFGYQAYCISETGRDQDGNFLPVFFKTFFGVMSNGFFYYFAALIIKILGPSTFALRFSSVLLGIASIFFTYKLTKLYFTKEIAILSAFLLSVSPWHIQISRIAMEQASFVCMFVIGFYFFSLGLKKNEKYLLLASLAISLTLYTYVIARLFVPLFYVFFVLINFKDIKLLARSKYFISSIIIILIMLTPFYFYSKKYDLFNRADLISIFNEYSSLAPEREKLEKEGKYKIAKSPLLLSSSIFINNYFKHMSTKFFLESGDGNLRHNVGGRGQILWFTFWMSVVGIFFIFLERRKDLYIFPLWFLLFPVPAALTYESLPHALRSVSALPVVDILASFGFLTLIDSKRLSKLIKVNAFISFIAVSLIVSVGFFDFLNYIRSYYTNYIANSSIFFDYKIYSVYKATEELDEYDYFVLPFNFEDVSFRYLLRINPKDYLSGKYKSKYIYIKDFNSVDKTKKIALILPPFVYYKLKTIGYVNNEITGKLMYEIKEYSN